jgi:hypothetical protein
LTLEYDFACVLEFGGVNTEGAMQALRRAAKGAPCTAAQLRAVASVVEGAERLRKQVRGWAMSIQYLQPESRHAVDPDLPSMSCHADDLECGELWM